MTTYFPFVSSNQSAFQFQPTLDGSVYTVFVVWNLFGQRYYVNCYNANSNLVFTVALIDTLPGLSVSGITYNSLALSVTLTTTIPHGYAIGQTINLTLAGVLPTVYNGAYDMVATGPSTLTFPLGAAPTQASALGSVNYLINLCKGYFSSTLIYRNNQFEVSP